MVEKHPDTGAFERLSFFIDQALKDRKISKGTRKREAQRQAEAAQQQQENEHIDAEQQRIEEMLNSLPEDGRAQLRERAAEEVSEEHGAGAFGHDMLVRLKMEELIRERDSDDVT